MEPPSAEVDPAGAPKSGWIQRALAVWLCVVSLGVYARPPAAIGLGRDEGEAPADVGPSSGAGGSRVAVPTARRRR
jgi:hypothetical protein